MSKSLGQHRPAVGGARAPRRRRVPLVLPDLQAAVGRLPVLDRRGRRVAAPVPAAAVEHVRLLRALRERQRRRARRRRRAGQRPRPLGAVAARRHGRDRHASASTPTTPRAPATRSPRSSTTSRTGTCAARGGASGTATPPRSRRCAHCLVTVSQLLAPFCPFMADEIYDNLDGAEPSVHLTDWPGGRRARRGARARDGRRARDGAARASPPAGSPSSRCASRCAPPWSSRPARSARRSSGSPTSRCEELNVKELRYVSQADELGSYEVKPNYRALGPRFGKHMPQVAAAVAALDPEHVARALRDGGRGRHQRRRPRPRARRRRPDARDAAARGLPARARGLARGGAGARARRRAAPRGPRARDRARGPERAQGRRACRSRTGSRSTLGGDEELLAAARAHEDYLARETLAVAVAFDGAARRRRRRSRAARWPSPSPRVERLTRAALDAGPPPRAEAQARRPQRPRAPCG